ncbi:hypothetical protein A7J57_22775 [Agrobacterium tumefaciens]|uniref:Uncharacterized protein n=1 Tax=Agrobacterium tumefaciens TaxID=358 RepID=A0A176XF88_AGRTU|nr:hypothetical protein A7J57_22775 [Agrobacterium tumefaciens]
MSTKSELEIPALTATLLKLERNVTNKRVVGQSRKPCSHSVLRVGQNRSFGPTGPISTIPKKTRKEKRRELLQNDKQHRALARAVEKGSVPYLDGLVQWRPSIWCSSLGMSTMS